MKALRIMHWRVPMLYQAGCERLVLLRSMTRHTRWWFSLLEGGEARARVAAHSSPRRRDERLWSVQEQRFKAWNGVIESVLPITLSSEVIARIKSGFSDIEDLLRSVWLVEEISEPVVRHTERLVSGWVADLVCHWALFQEIDARIAQYDQLTEALVANHSLLIVYGTLPQGEATNPTEERSEYAASYLAGRFDAGGVTFWNNTALLKSADEREVPSAQVIRSLSYSEASELSFFGSPIIDPQALLPAIRREIDVQLRFWGDEEDPGSIVSKEGNGANVTASKLLHHPPSGPHQRRGQRHEWGGGNGQPPLRRHAAGEHLGHPHQPGEQRVLHLLRRAPVRDGEGTPHGA